MAKKSFRTSTTPSLTTPNWARLLQTRREKLGLSREGLALAAGISPSLVAKLERGVHDIRDVSVGRLHSLLQALHLPSVDFLLSEDNSNEFTPSTPGVALLSYYPALLPACVGEAAPGHGHIDARFLPTRSSYTDFFLAKLGRDALCSEDLSIKEGSVLVVERRPARERGIVLLSLIEGTRRPLLYRLPTEPCLVRPVSGVGEVYWLLPDGALQLPAGKKAAIYPVPVGVVHGEFRSL
ncbi:MULTISPECIES: helix-turn-helix domain-containing protein [Calidithermus]|jgi:transcriptional regulator with XRE-family HTH domain|uniref:helix-turn-helix domain-containing protein n=1 Tax=Calidithermus TaxID=2747271 RepID=UPI000373A5AE|nr:MULTISPECIES: helix-turn-helix transcriptional regulator [Calidithermus]